MKKSLPLVLNLTLLLLVVSGCNYRAENYVFGTYYSVQIKGEQSNKNGKAIDEMFIELDNALSTSKEESDVYKINSAKAGESIPVSNYTIELFQTSKELYDLSNGAFNVASFPLTELWKFSPLTYTGIATEIPSKGQIDSILPYCSPDLFVIDDNAKTITKLHDNAKLDFGAIAKGFAADKAKSLITKADDAIIDVGRTFCVIGSIDLMVASPRNNDYVAQATLSNQSVATSGDYERYYVVNNQRYHHILAKNGYPANIFEEDPIQSVTIIGESATIADALSTTVFILGYEQSLQILSHYNYSALIITAKGYYTVGETVFEINDKNLTKLN
ncbi:MAG: FAD:protein FMN transferase [Clostridia bacterium]|nr:FAD:protein FMN transferase [Clostridia bacterium]